MASDLIDLRDQSDAGMRTRRRAWSRITGITLHQAACVMTEKPARWLRKTYHMAAMRDGQLYWLHPFEWITWHGCGLNARTVGLCCNGSYCGVEGDERTRWTARGETPKIMSPTPAQVEAAKDAVRFVVAEVARHGGRVRYLFAHRQASADRRSDPGSAIWQAVALPLMAELGLSDGGPGWVVGDGLPIPSAWDPSRRGVRY